MLNLPNTITLTRIALVVVFTAVISLAAQHPWGYPAALIVFVLAMFGHYFHLIDPAVQNWVELVLATPVVLWAGLPFFIRGFQSVANRSPNMWTLIGLGTGAAYIYSVVATVAPQLFPDVFKAMNGQVGVYFEAAAVIISLTLFGQLLELKARSQTSNAIISTTITIQNLL